MPGLLWRQSYTGEAVAPTVPEAGALAFPGLPNDWSVEGVVQHLYEDWSAYTTISQITSTTRGDGGGSWATADSSGALSFVPGSVDPWFGVKRLRQNVPSTGDFFGAGFGLSQGNVETPFILNQSSVDECTVIQHAWRCHNGVPYQGKAIDQTSFADAVWRWTHEAIGAGRMGDNGPTDCDGDSLCSLYYDDDGSTPLVSGIPGSAYDHGDNHWCDKGGTGRFYKQNRNASTGGWAVHEGRYLSGEWFLDTLRFTQAHDGDGTGRLEFWRTDEQGVTVKIMEYVGDSGQFDEGEVYVMNASDGSFYPGTLINFFNLTRNDDNNGWAGGSGMDFGGLSIITHPRGTL